VRPVVPALPVPVPHHRTGAPGSAYPELGNTDALGV
jgi:hypothetical protein